MLFFQAAFFYMPHFFWKACEAKLLTALTGDLKDPLEKADVTAKKAEQVAVYLTRNRNYHQKYFYYYTIFEICNFINVIAQIYVVDVFLGGTFTTYGLDVINYAQLDQIDRVDPMVRVFPRMTKCTFHRFGASGDVQTHDALCILPLNILNEKIYITMWFWFVFLAAITGIMLIYRACTFAYPNFRYNRIKRLVYFSDPRYLKRVLNRSDPGHWFVLVMMCKNMDSTCFMYVIESYARKLDEQRRQQRALRDSNSKNSNNNNNNKFKGRRGKKANDSGRQPMLNDHDDFSSDCEDANNSLTVSSCSDNGDKRREQFDGVAVDVPPQLEKKL